MEDTLGLSALPKVIRGLTGKRKSYQSLYRRIIDGDLPAEKNSAGHWRVKSDDLPGIIKKLGLTEGPNNE